MKRLLPIPSTEGEPVQKKQRIFTIRFKPAPGGSVCDSDFLFSDTFSLEDLIYSTRQGSTISIEKIKNHISNLALSENERIIWKCRLIAVYARDQQFKDDLVRELDGSSFSWSLQKHFYSLAARVLMGAGRLSAALDLLTEKKIFELSEIPLSAYIVWICAMKENDPVKYKESVDQLLFELKILDPALIIMKASFCITREDWKNLQECIFSRQSLKILQSDIYVYYLTLAMIKTESISQCYHVLFHWQSEARQLNSRGNSPWSRLPTETIGSCFSRAILLARQKDHLSHLILHNAVMMLANTKNYHFDCLVRLIIEAIPQPDQCDFIIEILRPLLNRRSDYVGEFMKALKSVMVNSRSELSWRALPVSDSLTYLSLLMTLVKICVKTGNQHNSIKYGLIYLIRSNGLTHHIERLDLTETILHSQDSTKEDPLIRAYHEVELHRGETKTGRFYLKLIEQLQLRIRASIVLENWFQLEIIKMGDEYLQQDFRSRQPDYHLEIVQHVASVKMEMGRWDDALKGQIDIADKFHQKELELFFIARRAEHLYNADRKLDALIDAMNVFNQQPESSYTNALAHYLVASIIGPSDARITYFYFMTMAYAYAHQMPIQTLSHPVNMKLRLRGMEILEGARKAESIKIPFRCVNQDLTIHIGMLSGRHRSKVMPTIEQPLIDKLYDEINGTFLKYYPVAGKKTKSEILGSSKSQPFHLMICELADLID
ncbi:Hypothetical protein POVR1_LOCUS147 [uncultured virus]|nr:Hypothetical protein POVR1_LOCUS147 [uncultured virus]